MTEARLPLDQALDLVFYGPLGLAMTAGEELPKMVDKARKRFGSQVVVARIIGQHALKHGQELANSAIKQSTETLVGLGVIPAPTPTPVPRPDRPGRPAGDGSAEELADPDVTASTNGRTADPAAEPPVSADLAIPGYDSLSASQVVQRLAGLAGDELEAVRRYEAAGRARRTVLNRILVLQTGPG